MNMQTLEQRKSEKGFTLVELAIVMIIIGLLIVGILKGQEMIANAQVTATVSQIKGLDAATSTFRDMYDAFPGDMLNAAVRLPNCGGGETCGNDGDGDSRIDDLPSAIPANVDDEGALFFIHMAAADLITNVSPNAQNVAFGESSPATEIGGSGFFIGHTSAGTMAGLAGTNPLRGGHYLGILSGDGATQALTPTQSARIDRKLDDGLPESGVVRSSDGNCITGTDYNEAADAIACDLFIRIQG